LNEITLLLPKTTSPIGTALRGDDRRALFSPGERVSGKVVSHPETNRLTLYVKGRDLPVETLLDLPEGVEHEFEVESVTPRVVLRLIPGGRDAGREIDLHLRKCLGADLPFESVSARLSGLRDLEGATIPPDVRETSRRLLALLEGFCSDSPEVPDGNRLREMIVRSGLFFENRCLESICREGASPLSGIVLSDVKGLILKLREQLASLSHSQALPEMKDAEREELVQGLGEFLRKIELYQMVNVRGPDLRDGMVFLLPLWMQDHLDFIEMNLSLPGSGSEGPEKEEVSMLFLLHLSELGKMRIEVKVRQKDLYCSILVSDPVAFDSIGGGLDHLKGRLRHLGYEPHAGISLVGPEEIGESLATEIKTPSDSLISIRV
jgi:hypothetical protein